MKYLFHILISINILFSQSLLSDRYTTFAELEEKIIEWDQEFGSNSDPISLVQGEGIIFHHEIIGYSGVDYLPIWAIKLSFNADIDEDEPRMLILGQCHAEEIYGVEIAIELIEWLLDPFNNANPIYIQSILSILNNSEVWVIPTHNPEGLDVVHGWYDSSDLWQQDVSFRKNKYDANMNGIFDFVQGIGADIDGVDLNRNYDFNWIFGDELNQLDTGCSGNPSYLSDYDYYRGPYPFSESEIIAIRDFAIDNSFLLSIAYHSSRSGCQSEKVISSWLWEDEKGAPDFPVISMLGEEISQRIPREDGLGYYSPSNSISMRGNAHDWFYNETGCIQYLIETGTSDMQPDDINLIEDTIDRNMQGLLYLLKKGSGTTIQEGPEVYQVSGIVTDNNGEPIIAEVKIIELDGPMLKPRYTDNFGRFRRILIAGSYTLEVSAFGYETFTTIFEPSSSSIEYKDVTLQSLPLYDIQLNFSNHSTFSDNLKIEIIHEHGSDFLECNETSKIVSYPQGFYEMIIISDSSCPEFLYINLNENTSYDITLKSNGVLFSDLFDNLDQWENSNNHFVINTGLLVSQNSQFYENNLNVSLRSPVDFSVFKNDLVLKVNIKNELEWINDKITFILESEDMLSSITIGEISGHDFDFHNIILPFSTPDQNLFLKILFESDNSVYYRGFYIDSLEIMYPVACHTGDLDLSGEINIIDILLLIDIVIESTSSNTQLDCISDLNNDDTLNIYDIILLVEFILNK